MATQLNRRAFVGAWAASGLLFGAQDFWDKTDPSAWTTDQILRLATRSPWAVQARVLPKAGRDKGSSQIIQPDIAGGRSGGRGTGPDPVVQVTEVTAVWASARPLLDALKSNFPADFLNHYVISVSELPTGPRGKSLSTEDMQAKLETKSKQSVGAGGIERIRDTVRFAFSKELLPLASADKEVRFIVETSQFSITARFDLKEMFYRGTLAV